MNAFLLLKIIGTEFAILYLFSITNMSWLSKIKDHEVFLSKEVHVSVLLRNRNKVKPSVLSCMDEEKSKRQVGFFSWKYSLFNLINIELVYFDAGSVTSWEEIHLPLSLCDKGKWISYVYVVISNLVPVYFDAGTAQVTMCPTEVWSMSSFEYNRFLFVDSVLWRWHSHRPKNSI
jgi:hypothetical protein